MLPPFLAMFCLGLCDNNCYPFGCEKLPTEPTYKLFGTKSTYSEATKQWSSIELTQLPRQFSKKSLKQVHNELTSENCMPVQLYYVGRHAARFPDSSDIKAHNEFAQVIQEKLKQQQQPVDKKLHHLILDWEPMMIPEQDNLITLLGQKEEEGIARRFKSIYPRLLDNKVAEMKIGVTKERRTSQTAVAFLNSIVNFDYPSCNDFKTNDVNHPQYSLEAIINNKCYEAMENNYQMNILTFHDECKKIRNKNSNLSIKDQIRAKIPLIKKSANPKYVQFIADSIRDKLGVDLITKDDMEHAYDICKYEIAMTSSSIWCSLFTNEQLIYLDYLEDVGDYNKDMYGLDILTKQTCPLVKDLVESLMQTMKDNEIIGKQKFKSNIYFTHVPILKRFFTAFQLFKDDENFTEDAFEEFIATKSPPNNRQWRSSFFVPFSGNIAFSLYKCKNNNFKLVTSVDEKPIKIGGCTSEVCDMDQFVEFYKSYMQCDLNEICSGQSN